MPRVDWTRILVVCAALLALAAVAWVTGRLFSFFSQTLTVLAVGAALAFLARPLVDMLARPLRIRALAVALVTLAFFSLLGISLTLLAGPVAADVRDLLRELPGYTRRLLQALASMQAALAERGIVFDVEAVVQRAAAQVQSGAAAALGATLAVLGRVGAALTVAVLGFVVALYLLLDGARIREAFYRLVPRHLQPGVERVERAAGAIFGGYLRGQLLLGLIMGVVIGTGSAVFGLPYPFLIGVLAGVFELIPSIGAVLGGILPLALALAQPFPKVLYVLAFLLAAQQLEGNLLVPRITGRAVGLHPLAALLALIAGLEVAGLAGAFLGAPVVAIVYRLALEWWSNGQGSGPPVDKGGSGASGDGQARPGLLQRLMPWLRRRPARPDR